MATTYRALGALLNAGVGPSHAFSFIAEGTASLPLKRSLKDLSKDTAGGKPFSEAAAGYPNLFPKLHRTIIAAGEASGRITDSLDGLAEMVERDYMLSRRVKRELMPAKMNLFFIFALFALLVILGLISWAKLSAGLRIVICVVLLVTVVCFIAATFLVQVNNEAEARFGPLATKVPAIGKVGRMFAESHFTTALAALHDAGVLPVRSIPLAADACGSPSMRRSLLTAIPKLKEGVKMADSLEHTGCLSSYFLSMITIGEEAGNIPKSLYKAQEIQAGEIEAALEYLKTTISFATNVCVWTLGAIIVFLCYGLLH